MQTGTILFGVLVFNGVVKASNVLTYYWHAFSSQPGVIFSQLTEAIFYGLGN